MEHKPSLPTQYAKQRAGFQIYLLGPPILTWNNTSWVITRRTVRALLYRLACEPEVFTRGYLQLLLWPDVPELVARRNLSHHLTHLRRSLPKQQVFVTDRERELQSLEEAFRQMLSNHSWFILISGEAGIGKSYLMHEKAINQLSMRVKKRL